MARIRLHILLFTLTVLSAAACKSDDIPVVQGKKQNEAIEWMDRLWKTSPFPISLERQTIFAKIQDYADQCPAAYFKNYLNSPDNACEAMEKSDSILSCYRYAFDRVLDELKSEQVEKGTVVIWMLYNMGYIVKTSSACFGIDIYHRWGEKLASCLDFLCITHEHQDHYNIHLMQSMFEMNKPVLSNFFKKETNYKYTSTNNNQYVIGNCSIKTAITNHNETAAGKNFVTVFHINCGADTENFTLLHVGDSNFRPEQYISIQGTVDLLIPRYSPEPHPLAENNIIGIGSGQVLPGYVLLSHILELSHDGVEGSRWPLDMALERASKINCEKSYVPFWGEKLVWKNKILN
jgi:hypothetical protein